MSVSSHASRLGCVLGTLAVGTLGHAATVAFEAESGSGDFGGGAAGDPILVSDAQASGGTAVDFVANGTSEPSSAAVTYDVAFPEAGNYNLYVLARLDGEPGFGNSGIDSFFIGETLGDPGSGGFFRVNNLNNLGAAAATDYLWYNLHTERDAADTQNIAVDDNAGGTGPSQNLVYAAAAGNQNFGIAGREVGVLLDAFVFSTEDDLTPAELDAALVPEPGALLLSLGAGAVLLRRRRRER